MKEDSSQHTANGASFTENPFDFSSSYDRHMMSVYMLSRNAEQVNRIAWDRSATFFYVIHTAVEQARSQGVEDSVIEQRVQHVLLSWDYAVDTFYDENCDPDLRNISAWTSDYLREHVKRKNRHEFEVVSLASSVLSEYTGESIDAPLAVIDALGQTKHPKKRYKNLIFRLPLANYEHLSSVGLWQQHKNSDEHHIGIAEYNRTSVVALRKIISDFKALRQEKPPTPFGFRKSEYVTADSWMLADTQKIELLFGESMDALTEKGLQWSGPVSITNLNNRNLDKVTTPRRMIGATVYSLLLRDAFLTDYIAYGEYPTVGAIKMPLTTFQNL